MAASAARCCKSATGRRPTPRRLQYEGREAARLSRGAEAPGDRLADGRRAARRDREDRRRRALPDRPSHSGRPVGREVGRRAALYAWPRERRLGPRDRLGSDEPGGWWRGDRAPPHLLPGGGGGG